MNPHFPRLAGYLARLLPVLAGCLCHGLLLVGAANAAVPSLELQRQDVRYPLASLEHSSGFVAPPPGMALAEAPAVPAPTASSSTDPAIGPCEPDVPVLLSTV